MTVDIFKAVPQKGKWATFNVVGDKYQGTYVDRIRGEKDKWGNLQDIFVLMQDDGSDVNVAVKHSKTALMEQCNALNLGQIVGFIFSGEGQPKAGGANKTKFINVVQDPNIVNQEWLDSQSGKTEAVLPEAVTPNSLFPETPAAAPSMEVTMDALLPTTPFSAPATLVPMTDSEKVIKIAEIAKAKFGAQDGTQVKEKTIEATGLAFIPSNLDAIIAKLETM